MANRSSPAADALLLPERRVGHFDVQVVLVEVTVGTNELRGARRVSRAQRWRYGLLRSRHLLLLLCRGSRNVVVRDGLGQQLGHVGRVAVLAEGERGPIKNTVGEGRTDAQTRGSGVDLRANT